MCLQECGLHGRGDADPEASVGRVRSHGGHFQDCHAAHEAHAARGRVRLLQGLPAAGVRGGEVAADGGRPAEPPLRAGQLLRSPQSPFPTHLFPLSSLARPAPRKPRLHRSRHRCSPGLSATSTSCHAVYNQCLPCQEGCQVVPIRPAKRENRDCCPRTRAGIATQLGERSAPRVFWVQALLCCRRASVLSRAGRCVIVTVIAIQATLAVGEN